MDATNGVNGGHPVVVGITGASGSLLARAAIDGLLEMGVPVVASASSAARMVWREEMDESFGAALERWADSGGFTHYSSGDLAAPIASGTFPVRGMAIVPRRPCGAYSQRHVSGARDGDRAVQHGDRGGGGARLCGQPDTAGG